MIIAEQKQYYQKKVAKLLEKVVLMREKLRRLSGSGQDQLVEFMVLFF